MPTWFWFVIAALAAGGGALLLLSDRARGGNHSRDRRRWAEEKSWEFTEVDAVLPSRWRYGAVHQGGPGRALDLATGAVPGPGGRRLAHVFDHEQAGQVTGVVAAVRGVAALPVAFELRLPSAPLPDDAGLDSLGQVGDRYAFVTSVADARPLITGDLARVADDVGADVPLLWAEESWVLATVDASTGPERVQALLQALVAVSVALEDAADALEGPDPFSDLEPHLADDDAPVPEGDAPAPEGDAPAPEGDAPAPEGDAPAPEGDAPAPEGDAPAPEGDAPAPEGDAESTGAGDESRPTHRERPADIPYDVEDDGFGPGARSSSSSRR